MSRPRVDELVQLAELGGCYRTYRPWAVCPRPLLHAELPLLDQLTFECRTKYIAARESLNSQVSDFFLTNAGSLDTIRDESHDYSVARARELFGEEHGRYEERDMVIDRGDVRIHMVTRNALRVLRDLLSDGGPGGLLHLFDFMNSPEHQRLSILYELAQFQSTLLNELLLEAMITEHLSNKALHTQGAPPQVLVVGGGPIGVLAAIQFWLRGVQVTLADKRPHKRVLGQLVDIDPTLTVWARWVLGSAFNSLLERFDARFVYHLEQDLYFRHELKVLSKRQFENAFIDRLFELIEFIPRFTSELPSHQRPAALCLHYGYEVVRIREPTAEGNKYCAILKRSIPTEGANAAGRAAALGALPAIDAEKAKSKSREMQREINATFDFAICAGGVKDTFRDRYLGAAFELTPEQGHGSCVFHKVTSVPLLDDTITGVHCCTTPMNIPLAIFERHLRAKPQLSELMERVNNYHSCLTPKFIESHKQLEKSIISGYRKMSRANGWSLDKKQPAVRLFVYDYAFTFQLYLLTNRPLQRFCSDLDELSKAYSTIGDQSKAAACVTLKRRVQIKIFTSLTESLPLRAHTGAHDGSAGDPPRSPSVPRVVQLDEHADAIPHPGRHHNHSGSSISSGDSVLFCDDNEINTSLFTLVQQRAARPAVLDRAAGVEALFFALGDSLASPHFHSGSGLSTGRLGVERAARLIFDYVTCDEPSMDALWDRMKITLNEVAELAMREGSRFFQALRYGDGEALQRS